MKSQVLNNVRWVAMAQLFKITSQVLSVTILARIIGPSEYGIMAMVAVVLNFALILRDLGIGAAIIQRQNISEKLKNTAFSISLIIGLLLCVIIIVSSPLISVLFHTDKLTKVLIAVSLIFPVTCTTIVHQALLEKESKFRCVSMIETVSTLLGLIFAIVLALSGFGVWSLVIQSLTTAFISSALIWKFSNFTPKLNIDKDEIRGFFSFSSGLVGFNIINYFSRNADSMLIGHFFSSKVLGAYSLAYRLMLFPLQNLTFVAARSLYPILSKVQNDKDALKDIYIKSSLTIAFITAPLMAGLWAVRESFVLVVFGENWLLVSDVLMWLAPTGFVQSLLSINGSFLTATGNTKLLFKLGIVGAVLQVGAFVIGVQVDVVFMAKLYLIANVLNFIVVTFCVFEIIKFDCYRYINSLVRVLLSSILMSVINILIQLFIPSGVIELILVVFVDLISILCIYWFFNVNAFRSFTRHFFCNL